MEEDLEELFNTDVRQQDESQWFTQGPKTVSVSMKNEQKICPTCKFGFLHRLKPAQVSSLP